MHVDSSSADNVLRGMAKQGPCLKGKAARGGVHQCFPGIAIGSGKRKVGWGLVSVSGSLGEAGGFTSSDQKLVNCCLAPVEGQCALGRQVEVAQF